MALKYPERSASNNLSPVNVCHPYYSNHQMMATISQILLEGKISLGFFMAGRAKRRHAGISLTENAMKTPTNPHSL